MKDVNDFIQDFNTTEDILNAFTGGYCWHFAKLLQATFNRGSVVWLAPFSHIGFMDTDGRVYDIYGEYEGEAFYYIPEEYCGNLLDNFRHIDKEVSYTSKEKILSVIKNYCLLSNVDYEEDVERYL